MCHNSVAISLPVLLSWLPSSNAEPNKGALLPADPWPIGPPVVLRSVIELEKDSGFFGNWSSGSIRLA